MDFLRRKPSFQREYLMERVFVVLFSLFLNEEWILYV